MFYSVHHVRYITDCFLFPASARLGCNHAAFTCDLVVKRVLLMQPSMSKHYTHGLSADKLLSGCNRLHHTHPISVWLTASTSLLLSRPNRLVPVMTTMLHLQAQQCGLQEHWAIW